MCKEHISYTLIDETPYCLSTLYPSPWSETREHDEQRSARPMSWMWTVLRPTTIANLCVITPHHLEEHTAPVSQYEAVPYIFGYITQVIVLLVIARSSMLTRLLHTLKLLSGQRSLSISLLSYIHRDQHCIARLRGSISGRIASSILLVISCS